MLQKKLLNKMLKCFFSFKNVIFIYFLKNQNQQIKANKK